MTARADTLLKSLQTPVVRDLAWACFSPPMILSEAVAPADLDIANCGLSLDSPRRDWLGRLDQNPRKLLKRLESLRSGRLGLYFEALWHFFLEEDERVELLGHNLPVRDTSHTIGEFDCLYYCRERQRHFHLELTVKFYLGLPPALAKAVHSKWDQWLGPGSRDRLDLKMKRMLEHQMLLGEHPRAKDLLRDLGIGQMGLEMEIKGRLFNCENQPLPPPYGYNDDIPMGSWTRSPATFSGTDCAVLEKQHWLAPVTPAANLTPANLPLSTAARPQLVGKLDRSGFEQDRFFLVPEHWPEQT